MGNSSSRNKDMIRSPRKSPRKMSKNVYNEDIQVCESRYGKDYSKGSMMQDGTCTEEGGGVHQICVKDIGKGAGFSKTTGQSDWSSRRGDRSHCVCLGAYANFVARQKLNDKIVDCDAIPSTVFDPKYVGHWSNWNDVTVPNQISAGIKDLHKQCVKQAYIEDDSHRTDTRLKNLEKNYRNIETSLSEEYTSNQGCEKLVPCGQNGARVYTKHNSCDMANPVNVLRKIIDSYSSGNKKGVWRLLSPGVRKWYKDDFSSFDLQHFKKKKLFISGLEWKLTYKGVKSQRDCTCTVFVEQKDSCFEFKMKRQYKADPPTEKEILGKNFLYDKNLMWWRLEDVKRCKKQYCSSEP